MMTTKRYVAEGDRLLERRLIGCLVLAVGLALTGVRPAYAVRADPADTGAAARAVAGERPALRARTPATDQQTAAKSAEASGLRVQWHARLGTPTSVRGKDLAKRGAFSGGKGLAIRGGGAFDRDAVAVLDNVSRLFRIRDAEKEFKTQRTDADALGFHHARMLQFYQGLPVVGGDLIVHFNGRSEAYEVNGTYVPDINVSTVPVIAGADAVKRTTADLAGLKKPAGALTEGPTLCVFARDAEPTLAWQITVSYADAKDGPGRWRYWVDAATGAILLRYNDVPRIAAPTTNGTNTTVTGSILVGEGGGATNVTGWYENTGFTYLYSTNRHWYVYNVAASGYPDANTYAFRASNNWAQTDRSAMSLARNFDLTQKYYRDVHGLNSFDGSGIWARANAHEGIAYVNAYWDGSDFHFGDGDGVDANSLAVLDIVGHEFTHAVDEYSANLIYAGESGALNESFSDIMGTCIEFAAQPDGRANYPGKTAGTADWLCGEDSWLASTALRDLRNPQRFGQPSRYKGTYWDPYEEVHQNDGVQNFFFYLLCEGGSGDNDGINYTVTGIGITNGAQVAYRALTVYCVPDTGYREVRSAWASAAEDLNTNWVRSVETAWNAAGMATLGITPVDPVVFSGPVGGPFTPVSQAFAITNYSIAGITWSASHTQTWANLSPLSGAVTGGGATSLTVAINSGANGFPMGVYTNTVTISNLTEGVSETRRMILRVGQPDYFTELFDTSPNDLDNQMFTFTPNGSSSFYKANRDSTNAFPSSASGTTLSLSDDSYVQVNLTGGMQVSFYGINYASLFVGANGYITFGSGDTTYSESFANHFSKPRISALFDDLNPGAGGTVTWSQLVDRVVITFQSVPEYGTSNQNSFQYELFFNGVIRLTFLAIAAQDGLAGLSRGTGVPSDFVESDLSSYGPWTPPDSLAIQPLDGLTAGGYRGGPFAPSNIVYTLTNTGTNALTWTATQTQTWVSLSRAGGVLAAGGSTNVTVALTGAAASLSVGSHGSTVTFSNTTSQAAQTRPVVLTAFATPQLTFAPTAICVTNRQGYSTNALLTIGNIAGADANLTFQLSTRHLSHTPALAMAAPGVGLPEAGRDFTRAVPGAAYADGRLLVRFAPGVQAATRAATLAALGGAKAIKEYAIVPGLCLVKLGPGMTVAAALPAFTRAAGVLYAEPDYVQQALRTPNDTRFGELWGMQNTGQTGGTTDADIDAPEAWDVATGSRDIVVAVIDTGVDYTHEDLAANMWRNPGEIPGNGVDDDGNGYIDDVYGINAITGSGNPMDDHDHGTHCAGTIGGVGNNGVGVAGVCWNVQIMALKFIDASGSGYTSDAIECMQYGVVKGARVLSNSWGGDGYEQALKDAIDAAGAAGVVFVAAAGNRGTDNDTSPFYPATYDSANLIAVINTTSNDTKSANSCYGLISTDLGAPGSYILSCQPGNRYKLMSGTSMATPHVAGACGLLLSVNPMLSVADLKATLLATVDPTLPGLCASGGRMNVARALSHVGSPWLTIPWSSATNMPPGSSTNVLIGFNGAMPPGRYFGEIVIRCNDRVIPTTRVLCTMVVPPETSHGTPLAWLYMHGLTNANSEEEDILDRDGDGKLAWEEYRCDTTPTNRDSVLSLLGVTLLTDGVEVRWKGGVVATQYIERASSLSPTETLWTAIFTNIPPTSITNNLIDSVGVNTSRFYRVRARR
jgi:Zn-dependent metalloprotease/subtilisin family serine protease